MKTKLAAFSVGLVLLGSAGAAQAEAVRLTDTQMSKITAGHKALTPAQLPTKPNSKATALHFGENWRYFPGVGWGLFTGWHTDKVTWATSPQGFFPLAQVKELQLDKGAKVPSGLSKTAVVKPAS